MFFIFFLSFVGDRISRSRLFTQVLPSYSRGGEGAFNMENEKCFFVLCSLCVVSYSVVGTEAIRRDTMTFVLLLEIGSPVRV